MKIKAFLFLLSLFSSFALANEKTIIIGSTPTPYGEILDFSKPLFEKRGYKLVHREFSDYLTPNIALDEKELDANLFQHKPFLDDFNQNRNTHLLALEPIVLVPMAIYSNKIKDLKELKDKAKIALPNDPTNESRALELLQKAGLIKLNDKSLKTPLDIISNPKKLEFKELKAAQTPRALADTDIAVITTNYALGAGLNPLEDGIFIEDQTSSYAIVIAVRKEDANSEKTKAIKEVLYSKEVADFIRTTFKGAVLPIF